MSSRVVAVVLVVCSSLPACASRPSASAAPAPAPVSTAPQVQAEPGEAYALTSGSKRLLGSLKLELRIDAYVTKGVPELDAFVSDLRQLLAEYERQGKGKLKVRLIEATSDEQREQAKQHGLQEMPFSDPDDVDQTKPAVAEGFLGLVFTYGSEKAVIPQLGYQQSAGLEFWISNKIRETRDKAEGIKHRIGVVTGKGEVKLSDANLVPTRSAAPNGNPTIRGILQQAFPFYQLEEVGLKQGASAVDPNLVALIVTQPQQDYTEPELRRIDEFLMLGGKSLVVYASAVNLEAGDPSMRATLSTRGLELLLDGYGLHLNQDAVFDHGAQFSVNAMKDDGQLATVRHPGLALVVANTPAKEPQLDTAFAGFFLMDEVMFPFPSSLSLARDRQPADVMLKIVARSTPQTSVEISPTVDMKLRESWTPKPPLGQRALAAYAEGQLQSAFASKPLKAVTVPARAPTSSRVLLVSSSLFLTNPFAYAGNGAPASSRPRPTTPGPGDVELLMLAQPYTKHLTATILSLKNTLDWMSGDEDLVAISAKLIERPHKK